MRQLSLLAVLLSAVVLQAGAARGDFAIVVDSNTDPLAKPDTSEAVFQCSFKDGRSVVEDGALKNTVADVEFMTRYNHFVFDAGEGTMTVPSQKIDWVVVRHGSDKWDLIAHLAGGDPVFNILRIEVWNTPMLFTMTDGTSFYSGICKSVDD